jgi:hypothetical protein
MSFYDDMAEVAVESIAFFGEDATLVQTGPSITKFDKRTGANVVTPGTSAETPVRIARDQTPVEGVDGRKTYPTTLYMLVGANAGDKIVTDNGTLVVGKSTALLALGKAAAYVVEVE